RPRSRSPARPAQGSSRPDPAIPHRRTVAACTAPVAAARPRWHAPAPYPAPPAGAAPAHLASPTATADDVRVPTARPRPCGRRRRARADQAVVAGTSRIRPPAATTDDAAPPAAGGRPTTAPAPGHRRTRLRAHA